MKIEEAIKVLEKRKNKLHPLDIEPFDMAISALRSQQEAPLDPLEMAKVACAMKELEKYRALGTLKELTGLCNHQKVDPGI